MPPIWSGTLTFGLVSIPIRMQAAVRSHKISFRQVHVADMGRVRYKKTCEIDHQVLDQSDIGRAYEAGPDHLVPIDDQELDDLPLPTAKAIEVSGFVPLESVPPEMFSTPYFLAPQSPAANKPYVLMRRALEKSGKAAVGKVAMRDSERLVLVRPYEDVLAVHTLHWPDELRSPAEAAPRRAVEISDEEAARADALIEAMGDVEIAAFHDEYGRAVEQLIDAKAAHQAPPAPPEPRETGGAGVMDLMAALVAAADQARADREKDADVHHMGSRKAAGSKPKKTAKTRKSGGKRAG